MVELHHERHCYPSVRRNVRGEFEPTEVWVDAEVMDHEDGFKLVRLGRCPPVKAIRFRYVGRDIAFDFYADREHWGGTVTGTYTVIGHFRPSEMLGSQIWPLPQARMETIAAGIGLALRAWPPTPREESIPIGEIYFSFCTFAPPPRVDYSFTFGHPLKLRHVPPSNRWEKRRLRTCVGKNREGADVFRDCPALVRDDATQLIRMTTMRGPADNGPDAFRYVDHDVSFDLTADRRFTRLIATDTWEVRLDPRGRNGLTAAMHTQLGAARCTEIVAKIEEALYAWVPDAGETGEARVPVNRVVILDASVAS